MRYVVVSLFVGTYIALVILLISCWFSRRSQIQFLSVADDGQFIVTVSSARIPWTQRGVLLFANDRSNPQGLSGDRSSVEAACIRPDGQRFAFVVDEDQWIFREEDIGGSDPNPKTFPIPDGTRPYQYLDDNSILCVRSILDQDGYPTLQSELFVLSLDDGSMTAPIDPVFAIRWNRIRKEVVASLLDPQKMVVYEWHDQKMNLVKRTNVISNDLWSQWDYQGEKFVSGGARLLVRHGIDDKLGNTLKQWEDARVLAVSLQGERLLVSTRPAYGPGILSVLRTDSGEVVDQFEMPQDFELNEAEFISRDDLAVLLSSTSQENDQVVKWNLATRSQRVRFPGSVSRSTVFLIAQVCLALLGVWFLAMFVHGRFRMGPSRPTIDIVCLLGTACLFAWIGLKNSQFEGWKVVFATLNSIVAIVAVNWLVTGRTSTLIRWLTLFLSLGGMIGLASLPGEQSSWWLVGIFTALVQYSLMTFVNLIGFDLQRPGRVPHQPKRIGLKRLLAVPIVCSVLFASFIFFDGRLGGEEARHITIAILVVVCVVNSVHLSCLTARMVLLTPLLSTLGCFGALFAIVMLLDERGSRFVPEVLPIVAIVAFVVAFVIAVVLRLHGYRVDRETRTDAVFSRV